MLTSSSSFNLKSLASWNPGSEHRVLVEKISSADTRNFSHTGAYVDMLEQLEDDMLPTSYPRPVDKRQYQHKSVIVELA